MAKKILVDVNGTLKNVKRVLVNVDGILKNVKKGLVNVNGILKQFWASAQSPVIRDEVELTKSGDYHNSTYPVTLTGKKYHFANADTFTYRFYRSSSASGPWTPMTNEITTTNPASGSSSTVTYQLTNSDFTESTFMYFKFEYTGYNTSVSPSLFTVSTSNIVTVTYLDIPAPPPGFPNINQSTISVASTASSGTWTGSPTLYDWKWQYGVSNATLTYQATPSISSTSLSGTTATATVFNHGFKSGDSVTFSGINDLFNQPATAISSVFTNFFSYTVSKPTWSFSSQYTANTSYTTYNSQIYKALLDTPTRTDWTFTTNYTTNNHVNYSSQVYKALSSTPTPRATWNSSTSYTTGQYVNYNGQVYQASGPSTNIAPNNPDFWNLIDIYPGGSGGYWTLVNIYPTSTTYWQSQNGSSASGGTATGPNYHEGTSSSPISYTINSFPSTDYKTGTSLQGLTTRMNVAVYNAATFNSTSNSASRTIYGYPSIFLGAQTITSTTASIIYAEANMDVYDISVRRQISVTSATVTDGGSTITYTTASNHSFSSSPLISVSGMSPSTFNTSDIVVISTTSNTFKISNLTGATGSSTAGGTAIGTLSGYPKTNQTNSSPISITGLTGGVTYYVYVDPKNADSPRVFGIQKTTSFTTPQPPVNTVAPTISPLNNRSRPPVSTELVSTQGTWTGVDGSTTYAYQWQYFENATVGWVNFSETGNNTNTFTIPSLYNGFSVRCRVRAANGATFTDAATEYIADAAVSIGTISPTSANQNQSTNFSFTVSGYPTSYTIDWGDGSPNETYTVSANTSSVSATHAHTYTTATTRTITVTAQPGSKTRTGSVSVLAPISITFDANSGTLSSGPGNGSATHVYTGNSGSTFIAPSAARTHFTFSTWRNPLSGGDPIFLTPGLTYTFGSSGLESSKTFFAIWTANTYTVTYNANGGSVSPSSASVTYPGSVTLPTPTRLNHTFNGWYTASSGGSFVGGAGSSYSPTSNITLFAQWTIIQYTVTWNANGGSVSPTSSTVNAGSSVTAPTPTRNGYTFSTWRNPLSGGDPIFVSAGGSYTPTSNIEFFAIWIANTYTVSYNANGGTGAPSSQTKTHDVTLTLSSTIPTRTNFTFNGWNTASDGSGTNYSAGGSYTANASATLWARWTPIQYTVTWDANGGTVSPTSSTVNAGSSVTAPTPTRSGFTFSTWRNPLSGGDPIFVSAGGSYTPTGNITFFAIWTQQVPGPPRTVSLTRNQSSWNGTSWTWNCTWLAPNTGGTVSTYEAYREVGTGTVGAATLTSIGNTSTPQTGLTTTSTTFSTTVQANSRADAYVRACNSGGCSSYVSGNVG